ncbi:hypothetical protein J6590_016475 [Homalodisca vitripennis]|nr:hypothetical protein J6590_016475 [Homalodisca vitripennis]
MFPAKTRFHDSKRPRLRKLAPSTYPCGSSRSVNAGMSLRYRYVSRLTLGNSPRFARPCDLPTGDCLGEISAISGATSRRKLAIWSSITGIHKEGSDRKEKTTSLKSSQIKLIS